MPVRIQRKSSGGWRMPPNTVYVGRPTKWGNPWLGIAASVATAWFKKDLLREMKSKGGPSEKDGLHCDVSERFWNMAQSLPELRGKDLACWCPLGQPCHADVLLELVEIEG